jgi:hypothetical protein
MKKIFLFPLLALFVMASCQSEQEKAAEKAKADSLVRQQAREKYLQAVDSAEKVLHASKNFDMKLANMAIQAYSNFTTTFPEDSMTPEYLFRAADLAQGTHNYQQAAVYLETIIEKHKGYKKYVDACFVAAFVYDTYLENVNNGADRAKQLYQFVIDHYPENPYSEQAKVLIKYIGQPDSVMINDIINKAGK